MNENLIKELKVVNIFPVCSPKPYLAFEKIKDMESIGEYKNIRQYNIATIQKELKTTDIIVAAWGKPKSGRFHIYFIIVR
ncbi:DUF1643 domain-containing protein [Bacillus sp. 1P10SD]|uniref:DUF1643 domain-containing protein n=1 Tax=Bacillus sp. 1P10SD TaxID=3132265 RepID=UPI0039A4300F